MDRPASIPLKVVYCLSVLATALSVAWWLDLRELSRLESAPDDENVWCVVSQP